jgi:hypothetical protein
VTAWPGSKTWELLDEGLAADLNTYVRDALDNLYNAPLVRLSRATTFSVPSSAITSVPWTTELEDAYAFHAANSANIVVPSGLDGLYAMATGVELPTSTDGAEPALLLQVNGYPIGVDDQVYPATGTGPTFNVATVYPLAAGDVVTVAVFQDSATAKNVQVSTYGPFFGMVWVAP